MARVTYGALITELAGSIGGITFQQNSSGSIARLKPSTPYNPSEIQQVQNNYLSQLNGRWPTLSAAEKLAWENFAAAHDHVNEWSETKSLNGFQWFMSVNLNRLLLGQATIAAAPAWEVVAAPPVFVLDASAIKFDVYWSGGYAPAGASICVYATPPLRQSSLNLRKSTFFMGVKTITGGTRINLLAAYQTLFNVTWATIFNSSDSTIIVRVKIIVTAKGLSSPFTSALIKL